MSKCLKFLPNMST